VNTEKSFWGKVDVRGPNECWLWRGYCDGDGYGCFCINGKVELTHRLAWMFTTGAMSKVNVLHTCDNPRCCNPAHLFEGTQADNVADMCAKGRRGRHDGERNGRAKLTQEQVTAIRTTYAVGGVTYPELGRQYGVSAGEIGHIVKGRVWA
jgi:hypothetical protein